MARSTRRARRSSSPPWPPRSRRMVEAERANAHLGREQGIAAARDRFYKGDIAEEMVAFLQEHGAPFELSDFAEFYSRVEEPTTTDYRGYTIYKHGFNSQGPVLLQALNILEEFDLQAMGHKQPRLHPHRRRGDEAGLRGPRHLLRGHRFRRRAGRGPALDHLCAGARGSDRPGRGVGRLPRRRPAAARPERERVAVLGRRHSGRGGGQRRRRVVRAVGRRPEGHHAHRRHRRGRQHLRRHAERRLDRRRGHPRARPASASARAASNSGSTRIAPTRSARAHGRATR